VTFFCTAHYVRDTANASRALGKQRLNGTAMLEPTAAGARTPLAQSAESFYTPSGGDEFLAVAHALP